MPMALRGGGLNGETVMEEAVAPSSWLQELVAVPWHERAHQHPETSAAALGSQAYCLCPYIRHRGGRGAWYRGAFIPSVLFGTPFVRIVYSVKKQRWLAKKAGKIQKALNKMAREKK